ncbi:cyanophycinase [Microlunatus panaciterrae]|uniref:Cyanophycinase n=1 Tax=Microlunatus panaciterrae TaxID=400768 RepID=A0ABS2RQS5_9ACTN|nr:cyanophycinase [Microlunatus panaciterrae]MBM7800284.1 cyanophycinase [Microlunatus panaciterrae]
MHAGSLFAIGGAEAKLRRRNVLRAFVAEAGGADARIVVIPTASSLGVEVVEVYRAVFTALGVSTVVAVRPESRAESYDPDLVARLDDATGIFMTGGNQLKLSSFVTGTPLGAAIHQAYHRGAVVGGTSAGASILSDHMIAFGSGGSTPKQRMSQLAVGLGLIPGMVIDQHFEQRNRYGRLMSIVAQSPSLLGVGVDEDTAAVVRQGHLLEVVGRGAVTVVDGSNLTSNAYTAKRTAPLLFSGATLHVLPAGSHFDLATRTFVRHVTPVPPDEVREVQAAEADLRRLARDIASDDVSPANYARRLRRGRQHRPSEEAQPTAMVDPQ